MHGLPRVKRNRPRGADLAGPVQCVGMKRLHLLLAAVTLALAPLAAAQPAGIHLEANWWKTGPTGTVQVSGLATTPGVASSISIDLEDDLGVEERNTFPLGVKFLGKSWRMEAEYLDTDFSAEAVLTREVVFQGVTYQASERVASTASLRDISGGLRFEIPMGPYASLGVGADADYLTTEATITAVTRGVTATDERSFVLPTGVVALNLHDSTRQIFLDVKVGYISYQGSRAEKARVEAGWAITKNMGLKAGWRLLDVRYVKDRDTAPEDRVSVRLSGFTAGLFLAF